VSAARQISVTVIIPAFHGDAWIGPCVDSLPRASHGRLHLVLIDNGGTTRLEGLRTQPFDCEVVETGRPLGYASANNLALVRASRLGDLVVFLNQDTISSVGWIDRCIATLRADDRRAATSPVVRTYDGRDLDAGFRACLPASRLPPDRLGSWVSTDALQGSALVVAKSVLARVGPFDPIYGSYYEDLDLCRRIRRAGYEVGVCLDAEVRHGSGSASADPARAWQRTRQIVRNRVIHRVRSADRSRRRTLARHLTSLPRNLARGLLGTPSSQPPLALLAGHWDLIRVADRLLSRRRDEAMWQSDLRRLGWPARMDPGPGAEVDPQPLLNA